MEEGQFNLYHILGIHRSHGALYHSDAVQAAGLAGFQNGRRNTSNNVFGSR